MVPEASSEMVISPSKFLHEEIADASALLAMVSAPEQPLPCATECQLSPSLEYPLFYVPRAELARARAGRMNFEKAIASV